MRPAAAPPADCPGRRLQGLQAGPGRPGQAPGMPTLAQGVGLCCVAQAGLERAGTTSAASPYHGRP